MTAPEVLRDQLADRVDLGIELTIRADLSATLLRHARRLKQRPVDLLADIIEAVLGDDLITAVLDR